jgi:SHS2 domain-containing protein
MSPVSGARHEIVDHTSEVTLRLLAPTFEALLGEAARAFGSLVPESARSGEGPAVRELRLVGTDRAGILVEWLNEIVYLVDVDAWLPTEVDSARAADESLVIRTRGVPLLAPFVLVKAATLHRAEVRDTASGIQAEVTLDV